MCDVTSDQGKRNMIKKENLVLFKKKKKFEGG